MKYSELLEEISADSQFDATKLDVEAARLILLQAKWLNLLIEERAKYQSACNKERAMYREKLEYYTGKAHIDVYIKKPFDLKLAKTDVALYVESDSEYIEITKEKHASSIKIDAITSFIKQLHERQWAIRNIIEWNKFTQGNHV